MRSGSQDREPRCWHRSLVSRYMPRPSNRRFAMFRFVRSVATFGLGAACALALGVMTPPVPAASPTLQNWHVHDCTSGCPYYDASGVWHQPVAFFPAILHESVAQYLQDPVVCPNATD